MGRHRNDSGDEGMVIRLLDWCGKHLKPIGLASRDELEAMGFDWAIYEEIRLNKIASQDDSIPGEADMPRCGHVGKVSFS